eukprot:jgi/Hompol1/737/HPOL_005423-RA
MALCSAYSSPADCDNVAASVIVLSFSALHSAVAAVNALASSPPFNKSSPSTLPVWTSFPRIAPSLAVNFPPNPAFIYKYPPPSQQIIDNIAAAIEAVPLLYTQVLHLMNKMNLPPPWSSSFPTQQSQNHTTSTQNRSNPDISISSTSGKRRSHPSATDRDDGIDDIEEEDKDEETDQDEDSSNAASRERSAKRAKIANPDPKPIIKFSIHSKDLSQPAAALPVPEKQSQETSQIEPLHINPSASTIVDTTTATELQKAPQNVIESAAAYRNYTRGDPSKTLFLKNIDPKRATEEELTELFKRQISVRLMKTGRMKGQAFVSFESSKIAQQFGKQASSDDK